MNYVIDGAPAAEEKSTMDSRRLEETLKRAWGDILELVSFGDQGLAMVKDNFQTQPESAYSAESRCIKAVKNVHRNIFKKN